MKQIEKFQKKLRNLFNAIYRFPFTSVFLILLTIINGMYINNSKFEDYEKYVATLIVGAFLGAVLQMIYERFFNKSWQWISLIIAGILFTFCYYVMISGQSELSLKLSIKTAVILSALFIAFIWVPTIKNKVKFHESFLVNFKGFFIALLFSLVFYAGISLIFLAIDQLLINISYKIYSHGANILFALFAPMYFLSITPKYPGEAEGEKEEEEMDLSIAISYPKYLAVLVSYIVIPLTMVFTLILILYISLNIGSEFWSNNLLEPMLLTYTITVILVYLLSSALENKLAVFFKRVFPKVLIPIVLLQTAASIIKISEMGITYGRYYVILFGVFAIFSGIIFSIRPVGKHGSVAAAFIILCVISIVPPLDAFSINRKSQIKVLEETLTGNGMLAGNQLTPQNEISNEDKTKIRKAMENLKSADDLDKLVWLPSDFNYYEDFTEIFGFGQYDYVGVEENYLNLSLAGDLAIILKDYDAFVYTELYLFNKDAYEKYPDETFEIIIEDKNYTLVKDSEDGQKVLRLVDLQEQELIVFHIQDLLLHYQVYYEQEQMKVKESGLMNQEEATYMVENEKASLTIVSRYISMYENKDTTRFSADAYIFITIKD